MIVRFKPVRRAIATAVIIGIALSSAPACAEPANQDPPGAAMESTDLRQGFGRQAEAPPSSESLSPAKEISLTPLESPETNEESSDMDSMDWKYFKGYATDTGKLLTSPLRWDANDWLKVGMVFGGTAGLFLVDNEIKKFAQSNQSGVGSRLADVGNFIGEPMYIFPAVGASYLYGHLTDNSKLRRVSLLSLESLTITGALTMGLKTVFGRHRPLTGALPTTWHGPTSNGDWASFSSGHTSNAFAVATIVANEYKDTPYVKPVAYGLATLTALARIYDNEHWASDTFFGAAIGYFVSKSLLSYHKDDKGKKAKKFTLIPSVGKEMTGVTVNYTF